MSDRAKPGVKSSKPSRKDDPFELPRKIAQRLRSVVTKRGAEPSGGTVKYLWINLEEGCKRGAVAAYTLTRDDWLNVIDEAAALGVKFLVVCVGKSFSRLPHIWELCRWAQDMHDITVGFHWRGAAVSAADLEQLRALNAERTWMFVDTGKDSAQTELRKAGVNVCSAGVPRTAPFEPCDGPQSLVFVGPEGNLYCCGVVAGHQDFRLGHVMEQSLDTLLTNPVRPRHVPQDAPRRENGCDGCPNQMARRVFGT